MFETQAVHGVHGSEEHAAGCPPHENRHGKSAVKAFPKTFERLFVIAVVINLARRIHHLGQIGSQLFNALCGFIVNVTRVSQPAILAIQRVRQDLCPISGIRLKVFMQFADVFQCDVETGGGLAGQFLKCIQARPEVVFARRLGDVSEVVVRKAPTIRG